MPGPYHHVRMSSRPVQPQVERRHRLRRVLVDQRGERLHVVCARTPRRSARGAPAAPDRPARRRRRPSARSPRASHGRAGARCSPTRRSSRGAPPTSLACHRRTSQRMSTARWRGGRCWSAATNARRIVSRATATSAGSPSSWTTSASGTGSIHVTSGSVCRFDVDRLPRAGRGPWAARAARAPTACRGRRSSRCGRATSGTPRGPRSGRGPSRRAASSPAPRPRPRTPSRASGSSSPSARRDAPRARSRAHSGRGSWHPRPPSAPIVGERRRGQGAVNRPAAGRAR